MPSPLVLRTPLATLPVMPDAEDLAAWASTRDEHAFAQLCRRHAAVVHAVCRRALGGDEHAAEDCAQAVFLVLARRAGGLRDPAYLAGWLHRTALNCARDWRRSQARAARREALAASPPPPPPAPV